MPRPEDVNYLELRDVLRAHANVFGTDPGQAPDHVRNMDGLQSVIARPRQYAFYQNADLALQSAVLSHGIAEGQLFVDGNKRTAAYVLVQFLEFNNVRLDCPAATLARWIFALSMGETEDELAGHLRDVMVEIE